MKKQNKKNKVSFQVEDNKEEEVYMDKFEKLFNQQPQEEEDPSRKNSSQIFLPLIDKILIIGKKCDYIKYGLLQEEISSSIQNFKLLQKTKAIPTASQSNQEIKFNPIDKSHYTDDLKSNIQIELRKAHTNRINEVERVFRQLNQKLKEMHKAYRRNSIRDRALQIEMRKLKLKKTFDKKMNKGLSDNVEKCQDYGVSKESSFLIPKVIMNPIPSEDLEIMPKINERKFRTRFSSCPFLNTININDFNLIEPLEINRFVFEADRKKSSNNLSKLKIKSDNNFIMEKSTTVSIFNTTNLKPPKEIKKNKASKSKIIPKANSIENRIECQTDILVTDAPINQVKHYSMTTKNMTKVSKSNMSPKSIISNGREIHLNLLDYKHNDLVPLKMNVNFLSL